MKKKNIKIWAVLLILPIPLLFLVAVLSLITRALLGTASDGGVVVVAFNIVSLLIGVVAVVLLMGIPVWIIMLVVAYEHNRQLVVPPVQPPIEQPGQGAPQPPTTPAV